MLRIAFIDLVFEDREAIRLDGCDFAIHPPLRTAAELIAAAREADVLMMRDQFGQITAGVLDGCPRLRLIVTRSSGHDHIDLAAARARGVAVANVPDYGAHMIAEHAFALMLAVARNVCRANQRYRRTRRFDDTGLAGVELYGKVLGVIGTGRIGRHSLRIGSGFGMQLLGFDELQNGRLATEMGFRYVPLDELLGESDFVTIHLPLTDQTRHLISGQALSRVKRGAILVNTSRGAIVDTAALQEALADGRLAGAGLDVLEEERTVYHDFGEANVIVTPHIGWYTQEARARLLQVSLANVRAWREGRDLNRLA